MRQVLFLDDDEDLREVVSEILGEKGIRCLAVATHDELVAARERALASDVAILDINLGAGAPNGLDAYRWLRANGFRGKITMLTGHGRSHPLARAARNLDHVEVLEKPISAQTLESLAEETRP